jgi:hypothetical protein
MTLPTLKAKLFGAVYTRFSAARKAEGLLGHPAALKMEVCYLSAATLSTIRRRPEGSDWNIKPAESWFKPSSEMQNVFHQMLVFKGQIRRLAIQEPFRLIST